MENSELVTRIEDLLYTRHHGEVGPLMQFDPEAERKVYDAITDGTLARRMAERESQDDWAIKYLPGQVERLEGDIARACERVEAGEIVGCVQDGKYYPSSELAGESLETCVQHTGELYARWHEKTMKRGGRIGKLAVALNAPGIALALVPTIAVASALEKASPSRGTSGNLGASLLFGMGCAGLGTVGVTAALTALAGPIGLAYGAAALGSAGAYYFSGSRMPKELESCNVTSSLYWGQRRLKDNLCKIIDEGQIRSWQG